MGMVLFANAVNAIGSVLLLCADVQISMGRNDKRGYWLYVTSCSLLIVGSAILQSWSIVILNVLWIGLSLMALWEKDYFRNIPSKVMQASLRIAFVTGICCLALGYYDAAAYMTTYIYFVAYAMLCAKSHPKINYLLWCSVGFVLVVPHLVSAFQYSVLISESLGFVIGIVAIIKIIAFKNKNADEAIKLK